MGRFVAVQPHGALTPEGAALVTGGLGQPTQIWAVPKGTRLATTYHPGRVPLRT